MLSDTESMIKRMKYRALEIIQRNFSNYFQPTTVQPLEWIYLPWSE